MLIQPSSHGRDYYREAPSKKKAVYDFMKQNYVHVTITDSHACQNWKNLTNAKLQLSETRATMKYSSSKEPGSEAFQSVFHDSYTSASKLDVCVSQWNCFSGWSTRKICLSSNDKILPWSIFEITSKVFQSLISLQSVLVFKHDGGARDNGKQNKKTLAVKCQALL